MPTNAIELQPYSIALGLRFVVVWFIAVFGLIIIINARAQYKMMNRYDIFNMRNSIDENRHRIILNYVKRVIFSIMGYQGEERERQTLDQLNEHWVLENFGKILLRFCIFFFVYIWGLVLTTRALQIGPFTGEIHVINYTSKQIFGFAMIALYIFSSSLCSILSIYFSVRGLERIIRTPNLSTIMLNLAIGLGYSLTFFLCSQVVSNLIWPLKTNYDIPVLARILNLEIALWPYAFIMDANVSSLQFLRPVFPGQLLITATALLPIPAIVLAYVIITTIIRSLDLLKAGLIKLNLTDFGIRIAFLPGGEPVFEFRCINAVTVGLTVSIIANFIYDVMKFILLR